MVEVDYPTPEDPMSKRKLKSLLAATAVALVTSLAAVPALACPQGCPHAKAARCECAKSGKCDCARCECAKSGKCDCGAKKGAAPKARN
jgi:hypothetical protein